MILIFLHVEIFKYWRGNRTLILKVISLGEGCIEGYHKIPISQLKIETGNRVEDIVLLCSNCHSMIHRKKECLTVEELKELLKKPKNASNLVHNAEV